MARPPPPSWHSACPGGGGFFHVKKGIHFQDRKVQGEGKGIGQIFPEIQGELLLVGAQKPREVLLALSFSRIINNFYIMFVKLNKISVFCYSKIHKGTRRFFFKQICNF